MSFILAPAVLISSKSSLCLGRSSTTTVSSLTRFFFALAIFLRLVSTEAFTSTCPFASFPTAILLTYMTSVGQFIAPRSERAITAIAPGRPFDNNVVPSMGSTAISILGPDLSPINSPLNNIGASSFSPSPITTIPSIERDPKVKRIASTAAWSTSSLSPFPMCWAEAIAAASVTLTKSIAKLRSIVGWIFFIIASL